MEHTYPRALNQRLIPQQRKLVALAATCLAAMASSAFAASYYVLPTSAGAGDGTSWANAAQATGELVKSHVDSMSAGDALLFGSGDYGDLTFRLERGGREGQRLSFKGVDTGAGLPLVKGSFVKEAPNQGPVFIQLAEGVSHVEFDGFRVDNYKGVLYTRGQNNDLSFSNFEVNDTRIGFYFKGGANTEHPEQNSHDIVVRDMRFVGFTKSAVRFEDGNYNVHVENVYADAGGPAYGNDPFHMAFFVSGHKNGPRVSKADDHHLTFINCEARNSYRAPAGNKYWNGDGFVAEAGVHNVKYINCRAYNCTDGGWDVKSTETVLENCVAIGSKRNVRIWGETKLINCLVADSRKQGGTGGPSGVYFTGSAQVTLENCTIINNHGPQIHAEKPKADAKIVIKNSLIGVTTPSEKSPIAVAGAKVELIDSLVFNTAEENPGFLNLVENWDGQGRNFNNVKFGASKGFYQK